MRIETIFGAVAVLTLIVLAAFALSSGRGASGKGGAQAAMRAQAASVSSGDACTCYAGAYEAARAHPDFTRPAYEGGYGACREAAGRQGGDAWSAGWRAGMEGGRKPRACGG